ncbi:MAG: NAD+ synthase [Pseudomonadota bacterium]|nr:NAD+ synthase [Pseudomonadota bacterium]
MRIVLAQINNVVGDVDGNIEKIKKVLYKFKDDEIDLVVFSELVISGYPPEDLVLKQSFVEKCWFGLQEIIKITAKYNLGTIVSLPVIEDFKLYCSAVLVDSGKVLGFAKKVNLPNYSVFDEKRLFSRGPEPEIYNFRGIKVGIPICEDIWNENVINILKKKGCEIVISPNGSPFDKYKRSERITIINSRVKESGLPFLYVNQVGGQDELVFDGSSLIVNPDTTIIEQGPCWEESFLVAEYNKESSKFLGDKIDFKESNALEEIYMATVIGLRDYVVKNNFPGVILGLSGGIDSALCAAIAVDALGPEKIQCFMMPSKFTSKESIVDAEECAKNLKIGIDSIDIEDTFSSLEEALSGVFSGLPNDTTEENIQSRIRGTILMAISNKKGKMLITTGNKSEVSVGYSTLYGDMNGGFNPIKDIYKTEVYDLANWRNKNFPKNILGPEGKIIPSSILEKEPSAELRENQKDTDSLPPYEELDKILEFLVDYEMSIKEIINKGFNEETIKKIENLLYISEYKRRQSAPGVKISQKNFGRDRRYPITNRFRDKN